MPGVWRFRFGMLAMGASRDGVHTVPNAFAHDVDVDIMLMVG